MHDDCEPVDGWDIIAHEPFNLAGFHNAGAGDIGDGDSGDRNHRDQREVRDDLFEVGERGGIGMDGSLGMGGVLGVV